TEPLLTVVSNPAGQCTTDSGSSVPWRELQSANSNPAGQCTTDSGPSVPWAERVKVTKLLSASPRTGALSNRLFYHFHPFLTSFPRFLSSTEQRTRGKDAKTEESRECALGKWKVLALCPSEATSITDGERWIVCMSRSKKNTSTKDSLVCPH
ncbi:hypothetical protein ANANG_G00216180, partial [Anguilla anguilla]